MKRSAFQFYPGDWQRDSSLRSCSLAARGLWIEMICIMHQSELYGFFLLKGEPITIKQLARMVGNSERVLSKLIKELTECGVFSTEEKDGKKLIFSRRMVKDEKLRTIRAESGSKGGNPNLVNQIVNQTTNQKPTTIVNQKPTPSSSSSSSDNIQEFEIWTQSVLDNTDQEFEQFLMKEISLGNNIMLEPNFIKSHENKCIRENIKFTSQQHFRKSLMGYLKSATEKNGSKKNNGTEPKNNTFSER